MSYRKREACYAKDVSRDAIKVQRDANRVMVFYTDAALVVRDQTRVIINLRHAVRCTVNLRLCSFDLNVGEKNDFSSETFSETTVLTREVVRLGN